MSRNPGAVHAAATRDLRRNLATRAHQPAGGSDRIGRTSTVEQVAQVWLEDKRSQRPALATRTLAEYAKWVSAYIDATDYGRLSISAAANVVRGEQHLRAIANGTHKKSARGGGEGAMRSARKVLHGIVDTAYRHGAIPVPTRFRLQGRTTVNDRRRIDIDRAFTREELRGVQSRADVSAADVGDLVTFLSVMGCRISEALGGVWWADTDLMSESVVIRGTKTKNAVRTAKLPTWLVERLHARADTTAPGGWCSG